MIQFKSNSVTFTEITDAIINCPLKYPTSVNFASVLWPCYQLTVQRYMLMRIRGIIIRWYA